MLAGIAARDAELLRANERLEARVAERTEQLQLELAERRHAERQLKTARLSD